MKPIPYGRQYISDNDISAVINVLKSDFLTQGPTILEFEKAFAKYVNAKYAIAVSNGTAALHLSSIALNIKKGDKIITSPITFVASANGSIYSGANVDFVDIDENTFLLDLQKLEDKLKKTKKGTYKAVIPVDFAGYPVNVNDIHTLSEKYNFRIIEDACHAPGGYFINNNNEKVLCGNGQYSDLSIFSFHPVKHIAAGEGGMITTNNEVLYKKLQMLRTHGITKDPSILEENHGSWYYEMHELGYNYRLTDFQAALGLSQLKRANDGIIKRNDIANKYNDAFLNTEIRTPQVADNIKHAYHLYVIQLNNRNDLYEYLRNNNIYSQIHYIPVHLQPFYKKRFGFKLGDFPIAEDYYKKALSIPMFPTLTNEEQDFVINKIINFTK